MIYTFLFLLLVWATPAWPYNVVVGDYPVTGSPGDNRDVPVTPSFAIHVLIIKCDGAQDAYITVSGMGTDQAKTLTTTSNAVSNQIQSLGTGTFQLGSGIGTQPASSTCYYVVFGDDGKGDFAYGVRTGNDTDDFPFTLPGFQPDFFLTFCYAACSTGSGQWRASTHVGNENAGLNAAANSTNSIQAFIPTGVTLGNSPGANAAGVSYAWFALKLVPSYNLSGNHTGTLSVEDIPAINTPTFAIAKADSATAASCGRWGTAGDLSGLLTSSAWTTNRFQAFTSTGFTRGTANCLNENTITTYWWVTKQPLYTLKKQRAVSFTGGF